LTLHKLRPSDRVRPATRDETCKRPQERHPAPRVLPHSSDAPTSIAGRVGPVSSSNLRRPGAKMPIPALVQPRSPQSGKAPTGTERWLRQQLDGWDKGSRGYRQGRHTLVVPFPAHRRPKQLCLFPSIYSSFLTIRGGPLGTSTMYICVELKRERLRL
jgi:hypothetical protein